MEFPTFKDKVFLIADNDTRLRQAADLTKFETYQAGDSLPAGCSAGDFKRLPKRTEIKVTDVKIDAARTVYIFAESVSNNSNLPSGWTKAANIEGRFMNEIVGLAPAEWDSPPSGANYTVTDKKALIRSGVPDFKPTGRTVAAGTFVVVTEKSKPAAGDFVRICRAAIAGGKAVAGDEIGWTAAGNLADGCAKFYGENGWVDQKGMNACWRGGKYIGAKLLVDIVGVGGEMEQITLESLEPYFKLRNEAAKKNLELGIESGFRTYQRQAELFQLFQSGKGNPAAAPGKPNHQHGQAFDLNTRGFDGDPMYDWLKKNAPKFGFIRTVNREHWHWEYRPADAAALAGEGKFALSAVKK